MVKRRHKSFTAAADPEAVDNQIGQMDDGRWYRLLRGGRFMMVKYIIFQYHGQLPLHHELPANLGVVAAQIIFFFPVQQLGFVSGSRNNVVRFIGKMYVKNQTAQIVQQTGNEHLLGLAAIQVGRNNPGQDGACQAVL